MLALPARARGGLELPGWLPSLRSLLFAFGIISVAAAGYAVAWDSSVFAIRSIEVEGAPPHVARRVQAVLKPLTRTNLVQFDAARGRQLLAAVPYVAAVRFDRTFPNTLRVVVTPERPVALLRRGRDAWVVSGRARVLSRVRTVPLPALPRVWLLPTSEPLVGAVLSDPAADAVRALVPMSDVHLPAAIRSVKIVNGELSVVLASGVRVLLGEPYELRLKLAVLTRILPMASGATVVDVSVPDRVVAGSAVISNPQVDS